MVRRMDKQEEVLIWCRKCVYEVTQWVEKRFRGECRAPETWKILRHVFLRKPDTKLKKVL